MVALKEDVSASLTISLWKRAFAPETCVLAIPTSSLIHAAPLIVPDNVLNMDVHGHCMTRS